MDTLSGGSSKTVESTGSTQEPWSAAQPALKKVLSSAQSLYNKGAGSNTYKGSLVVPYATQTKQGMAGIQNLANKQKGNLSQPMNQAISTIKRGGFNPTQQSAVNRMNAFAGGTGMNEMMTGAGKTLDNLNYEMQQGGGLTAYQQDALARSQDLAAGNEIMGANPGFQRNLEEAQRAARDAANNMSMATGRYNSSTHQSRLSEDIGDITADMYSDEYGRQLQRQDAARNAQFGMSQQGVTNQRDVAQAAAQLGQTAYSNLSDSVARQFEAGQVGKDNVFNAAASIPGAYNTMQQPYRDYMNIGGMQEDLQTRQMQDNLRKFREADEAGWDRLSKLSAIAGGAGALGNSTTGTVSTPRQSPFATALGGAIQGYGSNMFGGGLGGAAAGGALGFLGGF